MMNGLGYLFMETVVYLLAYAGVPGLLHPEADRWVTDERFQDKPEETEDEADYLRH